MIIDCFMFLNELDLLEIRLHSLAPYVDKFVLVESPLTHAGNPKPLFFEENKARFKDFNITHLISPPVGRDIWGMEIYQRGYLINGVMAADPEDMVLISDVDEIPDLGQYKGLEGVFIHDLYYYYLNCFTGNKIKGTIAVKKKNISNLNLDTKHIRHYRKSVKIVAGGGWHFSAVGSIEQIKYKTQSCAHQEFNTQEFKNKIEENRKNLINPYFPERGKFCLQMPSGPEWLLQNKEKYPHLWAPQKE
jgi:beta-1,4-mannosyl-glycoprotein beta-1,4-N-acetylglucosaminyltransferase